MAALFAGTWCFVTSAPTTAALPPEGLPEVAFAGRSNVGKSSLINALTGQKGLARTSSTPGRTQALNFYVPELPGAEDGGRMVPIAIVDLPGLGFAKAPKARVAAWNRLIGAYLTGRPTLRRVFLLVDARHGLMDSDRRIMALLDAAAVSYQIALTKVDKVGSHALERVVGETAAAIGRRPAAHPDVLATSSLKGTGIVELRTAIEGLRL